VGRGAARTSRRHRAGRVGNSGTDDTIRAAKRQHGPAANRQHRSTPDGQHDPTAERLRKRKPGSDSEQPECAGATVHSLLRRIRIIRTRTRITRIQAPAPTELRRRQDRLRIRARRRMADRRIRERQIRARILAIRTLGGTRCFESWFLEPRRKFAFRSGSVTSQNGLGPICGPDFLWGCRRSILPATELAVVESHSA
jgi:hypothetical protein